MGDNIQHRLFETGIESTKFHPGLKHLTLSLWVMLFNKTNGAFFSTKKMCTLFKKNAISCLFLKNVSPSERVAMFYSK